MEVYKKGKPRLVSIDVLKEFKGDNSAYGFPSDPSHSAILKDEISEVPNLMVTSTALNVDPTAVITTGTDTLSYRKDNMSNNEDDREVSPPPEDQSESNSRIMENNISGGVEAPLSPPPICLEDDNVDIETRNKFLETQDRDGIERSISNPDSDIILEPDINMDTSAVTRTQK